MNIIFIMILVLFNTSAFGKVIGDVILQEGNSVVERKEGDELKVNISNDEVDKLIKEYKKIKKNEKSNMNEIKKLGLLDKDGRPL